MHQVAARRNSRPVEAGEWAEHQRFDALQADGPERVHVPGKLPERHEPEISSTSTESILREERRERIESRSLFSFPGVCYRFACSPAAVFGERRSKSSLLIA